MPESIPGLIQISNDVLADLSGYCALEVYGVVGMAAPTLVEGVVQLLPAHKLRRGVRITTIELDDATAIVDVDLYVIIEYGTNLAEVSKNLAERVRYVLTSQASVTVGRVDVHVLDVKVR
ncbi:MAG: Asp23/Gls24 family envelope stress response protein [Coriobacteriia bacterium]|nr:Asp23/Gls24 family envelope stress response protein [Coriobacteriia bacterium]